MSSATAPPLFPKPPSMANSCLASHTTLFIPKASSSFLAKPIKLRLSSFPSWVSPLIKKKPSNSSSSSVIALVAQTSDWAHQDEDTLVEEEEEEGLSEAEGEEGPVGEWGGESLPEPPEEAKLFVGNLAYDLDSEKVAQLFQQAGVVEVAEVIYNRQTDQSRGFGFVTMSTVEEAEKAVEMFHGYDINGRLLTVNKASPRGSRPDPPPRMNEPSVRIYVGNLPWQVDNARLKQIFSEHGEVVNARVVCDRETGRSRGFGFVAMSTQTELNDAIAALDGQSLDGRALRVNVAEQRPRHTF